MTMTRIYRCSLPVKVFNKPVVGHFEIGGLTEVVYYSMVMVP